MTSSFARVPQLEMFPTLVPQLDLFEPAPAANDPNPAARRKAAKAWASESAALLAELGADPTLAKLVQVAQQAHAYELELHHPAHHGERDVWRLYVDACQAQRDAYAAALRAGCAPAEVSPKRSRAVAKLAAELGRLGVRGCLVSYAHRLAELGANVRSLEAIVGAPHGLGRWLRDHEHAKADGYRAGGVYAEHARSGELHRWKEHPALGTGRWGRQPERDQSGTELVPEQSRALEQSDPAPAAETSPDALEFYLGSHRPHWLALSDRSLFVSHLTLCQRKSLPRARAPWALDSGGFSELSLRGRWSDSAAVYASQVERYQREIGLLRWASIQDWMCEPHVLSKTGLSVAEHQRRTVQSYLELRELAPGVQWLPVLQGWVHGEHMDHLEMYARAGVDLAKLPLVGVGSVCRRQATVRASLIVAELAREGLRLHGFGIKLGGLALSASSLASADSMAWSYHARREANGMQNDLGFALEWADRHIDPILAEQSR